MSFDVERIRTRFPALGVKDRGVDRIYFDNPAGTQVPTKVIRGMEDYLTRMNANHGGHFETSRASDALLSDAHAAMADFLNAESADEIVFGANMTTLTFAVSRSMGHWLNAGDEIVLTRMDHDANIMPWVMLAEERGATVRWLDFSTETYEFDLDRLGDLMSAQTRLVAFPYASNATGTINNVKVMTEIAHRAGALVFVDAVQYAPHGPIDVQELDCDFLVCSAYKFFGPHQGVLWGKRRHLSTLPAYKVRPADDLPPGKFETGTQCHEGQAGVLGALSYLSNIGSEMGHEFLEESPGSNQRARELYCAMRAIQAYETKLSARIVTGLLDLPGIKIHGITGSDAISRRVPTFAFTLEAKSPSEIARKLAEENIFVWDGHYYAMEVVRRLGLEDSGGMVRVGAVHYNTIAEIDRLVTVLRTLV